jgi:hypothetical protein
MLLIQLREAELARRRAEEEKARKERRLAEIQAIQAEQEALMPGQRGRIDHILMKMEAKDLIDKLKAKAGAVDGLRLLSQLLPESEFPGPTTATCLRCKKTYDPAYEANKCRMEHPEAMTTEEWESSKVINYDCRRCGSSWSQRFGHYDGEEEGYCYQGPQEPKSRKVVRDEGWDDDEEEDDDDDDEGYSDDET